MSARRAPRSLITFGIVLIGLLAVGALSAVGGFVDGAVGSVILVLGALVIALGVGLLWWLRIDEAAREAHKWAWWWGGSAGMLVGMVPLLLFGSQALPEGIIPDLAPDAAFAAGLASILACQLVGYVVAWVWWWVARR